MRAAARPLTRRGPEPRCRRGALRAAGPSGPHVFALRSRAAGPTAERKDHDVTQPHPRHRRPRRRPHAGSTRRWRRAPPEEMRREQANPSGIPWVPGQNRAAAEADAMGRAGRPPVARRGRVRAAARPARPRLGAAGARRDAPAAQPVQSIGEVPIQDPA